jgi:hypothetical protein
MRGDGVEWEVCGGEIGARGEGGEVFQGGGEMTWEREGWVSSSSFSQLVRVEKRVGQISFSLPVMESETSGSSASKGSG